MCIQHKIQPKASSTLPPRGDANAGRVTKMDP